MLFVAFGAFVEFCVCVVLGIFVLICCGNDANNAANLSQSHTQFTHSPESTPFSGLFMATTTTTIRQAARQAGS